MSLRRKALLVSSVILASLLAVSYLVLEIVLSDSFARLEERAMRENTARALNALAVNRAQLVSAASDWAWWDDTYAFVEDGNGEYIEANLTDSAFANLKLNLMVFVHSSGRVVIAKGYDLSRRTEVPAPASLAEHLTRDSLLLNHPDDKSGVQGVVVLPEGPLLVAALPILTSQDEGPSRGTLIFGRWLDPAETARLAQITQLSLAIQRLDHAPLPADVQAARAALSEQMPVVVRALSEQTVAGYALVNDIYDRPAFVLRAEAARDIYQQGNLSKTYLIALLLGAGIVGYVLIAFGIERLVLSRLARLSENVRRVGADGDPARRVLARGSDEIASLAREINRMLQAIQTSEQRYRALFEGAPMIIYALDSAGRFTALNPAFEQITGWTRAEWLGRSFAEIVPPQDVPEMQQVFQQALRGELPKYAERRILSKTGDIVTVELLGLPQMENDQVVGVTGFALDITERKRAAEALRESEEKYRTLVERANDGIVILQDGLVQYANPRILDAWGGAFDEVVDTPFINHLSADDLPALLERYQRRLAGEDVNATYETTLHRKDGVTVPVEINAALITYREKPAALVLIHDLTKHKQAEEALRESEEKYRALVENINEVIYTLDLDGRFTFVSPVVERLSAYKMEDLLGRRFTDFVHPGDLPSLLESYHRTMRGEIEPFEYRIFDKNGQVRYIRSSSRLIIKDAAVAGISGVMSDVTARKNAEVALRESEERYRDLVEHSHALICTHDLQGRFLSANQWALDLLGYEPTAVTRVNLRDLLAPEVREQMDEYLARIQRDGGAHGVMVVQTRAGEKRIWEYHNTLRTEGVAEPIVRGIAHDITEQKQLERALRESEERWRTYIEQANDLIFALDAAGRFTLVNRAACNALGHSEAELRGTSPLAFIAPETRDAAQAALQRVLQGEDVERFELQALTRDQQRIALEVRGRTLRQDGQIAGTFHIARDITERKEYSERLEQMVAARTRELRDAQEQLIRQERLAVLGQLAGGIAHELRSPLSAIKNAAYYFKMVVEHPAPDAREMMDILDQQIDVSARIINSLLDFARPKTPALQPTQLSRVVDAAICQCNIPQNIAVAWQADESLPPLQVDAEQMRLVLGNLITNAAQAMPHGGQLTIATQLVGDQAQVTVSDTGVGIAPDALDKVFQPLYTTKAKGIGLGLALSRIIVEAHGGAIVVTSVVGKGTTFVVSLPRGRAQDR